MLYEKVLEMGNVDFTDTSTFTREQWLELRRTGIGGSDAGAILGLNKYSTPLSVYLAKKDFASVVFKKRFPRTFNGLDGHYGRVRHRGRLVLTRDHRNFSLAFLPPLRFPRICPSSPFGPSGPSITGFPFTLSPFSGFLS